MTKPIKHNNCSTGCHGSCCLKVQDLTVIRGDDAILDHVNFHMHCGELIALIGPNGAGKSSLFKSILGQMSGASGSISFQTATGEHLKPRIGYVPQSPSFDPGDPVSVLDLFVTAISRWPVFLPTPAKLRSKVLECLKRVNAETLIEGLIAGLIGIGLTLLLIIPINAIVQHLTGIASLGAVLPPVAAVLLVAISMLLTFIAGLIPSRFAAKKDPVVALRTE